MATESRHRGFPNNRPTNNMHDISIYILRAQPWFIIFRLQKTQETTWIALKKRYATDTLQPTKAEIALRSKNSNQRKKHQRIHEINDLQS